FGGSTSNSYLGIDGGIIIPESLLGTAIKVPFDSYTGTLIEQSHYPTQNFEQRQFSDNPSLGNQRNTLTSHESSPILLEMSSSKVSNYTASLNELGFKLGNNNELQVSNLDNIPQLRFLQLLPLNTSNLSIEFDKPVQPTQATLKGTFTLPQLMGATVDLSQAGNGITLKKGGQIEFGGTFSVEKINFSGGKWGLENVSLGVNTNNQTLSATGTLRLPSGLGITPTLQFQNRQLNTIGLNVNFGGVGKPIIYGPGVIPLVYLQEIGMQATGLAKTSPQTPAEYSTALSNGFSNQRNITLTGNLQLTAGPSINIQLPNWMSKWLYNQESYTFNAALSELNLTGSINKDGLNLNGDIKVVGDFASGNGSVDYNWKDGTFKANFLAQGLKNAVSQTGGFSIDRNAEFNLHNKVSAQLPDFIPIIGGNKAAESSLFLTYSPRDNNTENDYLAVWSGINLPLLGQKDFGVQVMLNSTNSRVPVTYRSVGAKEIPSIRDKVTSIFPGQGSFSEEGFSSEATSLPLTNQRELIEDSLQNAQNQLQEFAQS
ncbi:MAG: hypothetical protein ACRCU2_24480, partial [Planktothrix sp.]